MKARALLFALLILALTLAAGGGAGAQESRRSDGRFAPSAPSGDGVDFPVPPGPAGAPQQPPPSRLPSPSASPGSPSATSRPSAWPKSHIPPTPAT